MNLCAIDGVLTVAQEFKSGAASTGTEANTCDCDDILTLSKDSQTPNVGCNSIRSLERTIRSLERMIRSLERMILSLERMILHLVKTRAVLSTRAVDAFSMRYLFLKMSIPYVVGEGRHPEGMF